MRDFEYFRPSSIQEACRLLAEPENNTTVLAGGTDLLVQMKLDRTPAQSVVSLRDIPALASIRALPGGGIAIGAMTTLRQIETSETLMVSFKSIGEAARLIGSPQIRSRATVGGNLCNAAPSADMAPILLAHQAKVVITNGDRERSLPLTAFFRGPGHTDLQPGELLKEIHLSPVVKPTFSTYLKAYRSRMDIALTGVAVSVTLGGTAGPCRSLRLALGAVGPTPFLVGGLDDVGSELDEAVVTRIARHARQQARPISDLRATEDYRRTLVEVLTRRALLGAREWILSGAGL